MGLLDWLRVPAANADDVPDGLSARQFPAVIRDVRAQVRRYADDMGGALTTSGNLNAYVVSTGAGVDELRAGIKLLIRADRANTGEATINVDGLGPLPWVDAGGVRLSAGQVAAGRFYEIVLDPVAPAWRVQAGASTLDEIPGLIGLRAEVATNATDARSAATSTAADRTATAADRATAVTQAGIAVVSRTASEAARDVATGARDAAQTARTGAETARTDAQTASGTATALVAEVVANQGARLNFQTVTDAAGATIPAPIKLLYIGGAKTQGIGPALYRPALTQSAGAGKFQTVDGRFWELTSLDGLSLEVLGAGTGSAANDTGAIRAANALTTVVRLDTAIDVTDQNLTLADYWNAVIRGAGSIANLYGKTVVPEIAPSDHMECGADLIPEIHLRQFNSVAAPKVVHVGDSISTYFANSLGHSDMLTALIEATLRRQCASRNLTFVNRAIGGMSWAALNVPVSRDYMPPWYTDPNKKWIDYIADEQPDLVVFSLGMNISQGGEIAQIRNALATIATWPKRPDVIFCTNLVPRPIVNSSNPSWNTREDQEARWRVAGLVRTFARSQGYGLLDFGRKQNLAQHGVDPTAAALRRGGVVSPAAGAGNTFFGTRECRHFGVRLALDPSKLVLNGSQIVSAQIGAGSSDVVQISKFGATQNDFLFSWFTGSTDAPTADFVWRYAQDTVQLFPDTNGLIYLRIEVLGGQILVFRETQFPAPPYGEFGFPIVRRLGVMHGGIFSPRIGENTTTPCVQLVDFDYGDDRLNAPSGTSDQIWSTGVQNVGDAAGSGYNHHSNYAATLIYLPVLNSSRFVTAAVNKLVSVDGTKEAIFYNNGTFSVGTGLFASVLVGEHIQIFENGADGSCVIAIGPHDAPTAYYNLYPNGAIRIANLKLVVDGNGNAIFIMGPEDAPTAFFSMDKAGNFEASNGDLIAGGKLTIKNLANSAATAGPRGVYFDPADNNRLKYNI